MAGDDRVEMFNTTHKATPSRAPREQLTSNNSSLFSQMRATTAGENTSHSDANQSHTEKLFNTVASNFRASLSLKQQKIFQPFQTPTLMVQEIKKDVETYQNKRKLGMLCRKIEKFSTAWAPFFEITGIFVQSNPEYAALAWGAVRLVFLVRNFVS